LTSLFGRIEVASCEKTEDFERFALHKGRKLKEGQTRKKKPQRKKKEQNSLKKVSNHQQNSVALYYFILLYE
jgi:hypothetical protein